MKKNYNQLTDKDRHQLELLISQGTNKTQIAKILEKNRTTIHRELQRGCTFKGKYLFEFLQPYRELKFWAWLNLLVSGVSLIFSRRASAPKYS